MSNGIRITRPTDFMGNPLATEAYVETTVKEKVANVINLPEGVDTLIDPATGKLNESLNPGITIQMKGVEVEKNATKVNFIGNCMVVTDGNGFITARIGDNLNSSNFNSKDGQTNGTVSKSTAVATSTATPAKDGVTNGTTTVWLNSSSGNKVTLKSAGPIHFDNTATHFEVVLIQGKEGALTTTTYYLGKVASSTTYTAKKDSLEGAADANVTMVVSNFKAESKTAEGATGYEGSVSIVLDIKNILAGNTDFKVAIRHINGAEGTKYWGITTKTVNGEVEETYTDSYIHFIKDTTTKPSVTGTVSFTISDVAVKQISGVSFLTKGTVNVSAAGITNLSNPASVNNKVYAEGMNGESANAWFTKITQAGTTGLTGFNGNSTDSVSYAGSSSIAATGHYATAKVKVYGNNVNGAGTAVSSTNSYNLLVDKTSKSASTALAEYFASETDATYPRYKNDCTTTWKSSWSLASDGSEGLQILNGQLRYPTGTYTNTNDGLGGIVGTSQPNYSSLTGDRSFVRYFAKSGSLSGGVFTLKHTKSIKAAIDEGTLNIEVSKDKSKWYDIARLSGIGTAFTWGTTESKITFAFTDGVATNGMWFRIRIASSSVGAIFDSVTMA